MNGWLLTAGSGTAVVGVLVLVLCLALARWPRPPVGRRTQAALWLLVPGVCAAVLLALRPEREVPAAARPGNVLLLRDTSGSMDTPDGPEGQKRRTDAAAALARDLRARLAAAAPLTERTFGAPAGAVGGTPLHEAVMAALAETPTAIVLLSDGAVNAGPDPRLAAETAAQAGVPLFTVCLGRPEALPTLSVAEWAVPERCAVGDLAILTARVANTLPAAWEGDVQITAAGRPIGTRHVQVGAGQSSLVTLRWRPAQPGVLDLTLALPIPPGDAVPADNRRTAPLRVDAEPMRILAVDLQPRWEFRHAVKALRATGTTRVRTLLLDPILRPDEALPADLRGEDIAAEDSAPDRLRAFPARADLDGYDVVLLGSVRCDGEGGGIPEGAAAELRQAVEETGLGLILLPGAAAGPTAWSRSPLAPLLPLLPAPGNADAVVRTRTAAKLRLTADAGSSALTALGSDPDDDARMWQQLPGLQRHSACGGVRPGSIVLAMLTAAGTGGSEVPVLVFRTAGLGRALYLGSDQWWRWRGATAEDVHGRLWQAAARVVARRAPAPAGSAWRVLSVGAPVAVGEPVILDAIPAAGAPPGRPAALGCTLRGPQAQEVRVTLTPAGGGLGALSGQVALPEAGVWTIWPDGAGAAAGTVTVSAGPTEVAGVPAHPELLDAMALRSGGRRFDPADPEALAAAVAAARGQATTMRRWRPWTHPAWVGTVVLLLGLGLALREITGDASP